MAKPFSRQMGRDHFPELRNENLASFNQSSYWIEVGNEITLKALLDPMLWGPQPKLKRGDFVTCMRADNAYFAQLIVEGTSAGYPTLKPFVVVERDQATAAAEPLRAGDDGVEMILTAAGAAHLVTHNSEIAAVRKTAEKADAALAALVAGNA